MDIHLFVSAVIQIFISAQAELLKACYSKAMITYYSPKSVVQKYKNSLKNTLCSIWTMFKKGNEKSWRHDTFYKSYAEQSKTQKNKNSKPINLTFYHLDHGALRKEHLDSLTDLINRHEQFKGS